MKHLRTVGGVLSLVPAIMFLIIGVRAIVAPEMLEDHQTALGVSPETLPPTFLTLYFVVRTSLGGAFVGSAAAIFAIFGFAFRRDERWAAPAILLISLCVLGPLTYAARMMGTDTPAKDQTVVIVALVVIAVAGFAMSLVPRRDT